ncbi:hypothetical protein [Lutimonas zeaxanthinifaciens]|uniref:hypothetical protein n=1 Tax=Lutimonas zeaxanthinifaciens TaxID=3060215 RepID=UPI00265CACB5|nr:hypothetical protein [Lutimonas sp. YSD2104]WKK64742.1 hypothetical protein QZH61_09095 [Lutimonas sp. YSD2104]
MASIRKLKKDMNTVLSDIIEDCYVCQLNGDDKVSAKAEKIIDEAIQTFDDLIAKLHQKDVDNVKAHLREVRASLGKKSEELSAKITKLTS